MCASTHGHYQGQVGGTLGAVGHMGFVATTQLAYFSSKAAIDDSEQTGLAVFQLNFTNENR